MVILFESGGVDASAPAAARERARRSHSPMIIIGASRFLVFFFSGGEGLFFLRGVLLRRGVDGEEVDGVVGDLGLSPFFLGVTVSSVSWPCCVRLSTGCVGEGEDEISRNKLRVEGAWSLFLLGVTDSDNFREDEDDDDALGLGDEDSDAALTLASLEGT